MIPDGDEKHRARVGVAGLGQFNINTKWAIDVEARGYRSAQASAISAAIARLKVLELDCRC